MTIKLTDQQLISILDRLTVQQLIDYLADDVERSVDWICDFIRNYVDSEELQKKIMNSMPISSFQTIAESARRALYVCDGKGTDSPFRILSEKYADHYGDWKEIFLRFNPLQGIH